MNLEIDYLNSFNYLNSLRKIGIVTTGRTGSDFFQSLLDGHAQVLQIPGIWFFYNFWNNAVCKESISDLVDEFIWYNDGKSRNIFFFKSKYHKMERWDQLGEGRNECFEVDTTIFKTHVMGFLRL
jgi:hypothetical protein